MILGAGTVSGELAGTYLLDPPPKFDFVLLSDSLERSGTD
jgi:hypothetical protein